MHRSILETAHELLQELGLRGFTIEEVAARSGAAKTTIYRAWPNRGVLAVESFLAAMAPRLAYPDVPSAIESVRQQLLLVVRAFRGAAGLTMAGLIAESRFDPQTARFYLERYVIPSRADPGFDQLRRPRIGAALRAHTHSLARPPIVGGRGYFPLEISAMPRSDQLVS